MLEEYRSHNGAALNRGGERYLTLADLRTKLGGRSRSAIYADLVAGRLPQPFKVGARNYWSEAEVDAHLREMRGAAFTK